MHLMIMEVWSIFIFNYSFKPFSELTVIIIELVKLSQLRVVEGFLHVQLQNSL